MPKKHPLSPGIQSPPSTSNKTQRSDDIAAGHASSPVGGARRKVIGAPPRTGQACDRCKSRKIRCDDTQGGCLPCRQSNTECKTTDRITHRATARGHTESLERDVSILRQQVAELEQQVKELGLEPRTHPHYLPAQSSSSHDWHPDSSGRGLGLTWDSDGPAATSPYQGHRQQRPQEANMFALPPFRSGLQGDNYLGISTPNDLSSIKGTSLSLFGMHLDISDFVSNDPKDPIASYMSYEAVVSSLAKRISPEGMEASPELPKTYEECANYTHWYTTVVLPWMPMVQKSTLEELVAKIYQGYQPTMTEDVMVHIVLAYMKFQIAFRNDRTSEEFAISMKDSLTHFHYCLTRFVDLMNTRTLEGMQVVVMICALVRSFPKPGAAWLLLNSSMSLCVEMGLHRSASAWHRDTSSSKDVLEVETRKRIFWTLLLLSVPLCGKLGRPMPLRLEDFDIEIPQSLNENLRRAEGGVNPNQCTFHGAIEFFKMTELFMDAYSSIYAIRPTQNYDATVRRLEIRAQKWKRELPDLVSERAFANVSDAEPAGAAQMLALWMIYWECEFQLIVHHPALCTSKSPETMERNLSICSEAASKLIETAVQLWGFRNLDTTWYNLTTFVGAIFTLLFAMWQRREHITSADLSKLESETSSCMNIVGAVGIMLGSGSLLRDRTQEIVDAGFARIRRFHTERTASAAVASAGLKSSPPHSPNEVQAGSGNAAKESRSGSDAFHTQSQNQTGPGASRSGGYIAATDPALPQSQTPYAAAAQGTYPHPSAGSVAPYPYHNYPSESNSYNEGDMGINGHNGLQSTDGFMFGAGAGHAYQGFDSQSQVAWRQWVDQNTRNNHDGPEYMNSASALMALGGRDLTHAGSPQPGQPMTYSGNLNSIGIPQPFPDTNMTSTVPNQAWPMNSFDPAASRGNQ